VADGAQLAASWNNPRSRMSWLDAPTMARLDDAAEVHAGERGAVGVQAECHPDLLARRERYSGEAGELGDRSGDLGDGVVEVAPQQASPPRPGPPA
jgi:hypothetical protein